MKSAKLLILSFIGLLLFISCDLDTLKENEEPVPEETIETLYVKFINESTSLTIKVIELQAMGNAGTADNEPLGEYGNNILTNNKTIAPGAHEFFTLEIPNSNYSRYRLGVDDGSGNTIMLHEQENFNNETQGTITHWGGDDRTVYVTLVKDESTGFIHVQGWGDNVGIE